MVISRGVFRNASETCSAVLCSPLLPSGVVMIVVGCSRCASGRLDSLDHFLVDLEVELDLVTVSKPVCVCL